MEISGKLSQFPSLSNGSQAGSSNNFMVPVSGLDTPHTSKAGLGIQGLSPAELGLLLQGSGQQLQMQMFVQAQQEQLQLQQLHKQMGEMQMLMKQYQLPTQHSSLPLESGVDLASSSNTDNFIDGIPADPNIGSASDVPTPLRENIKTEELDPVVSTTIDRKPVVQSLRPSATVVAAPVTSETSPGTSAESRTLSPPPSSCLRSDPTSSPPGLIPLASLQNIVTPSPSPITMDTSPQSPLDASGAFLANQMAALASQQQQMSMLPTATDQVAMTMRPMLGKSAECKLLIARMVLNLLSVVCGSDFWSHKMVQKML